MASVRVVHLTSGDPPLMTRIAICGAGAIGGCLGAQLALAREDITLVACGDRHIRPVLS